MKSDLLIDNQTEVMDSFFRQVVTEGGDRGGRGEVCPAWLNYPPLLVMYHIPHGATQPSALVM